MAEIINPTITINAIDKAWADFLARADRAEQYQFPKIAVWHFKLEPFYKNLHDNWDVHHAEVFMRGLTVAYTSLGWLNET